MRAAYFPGRLFAAVAVMLSALAPLPAAAQGGAASGSGPMIVERIKSGFLVAPDFKVTQFDHTTSELAGAYAGWLTDQTFFVGGGGYWLANRSHDRDLAYGGLVLGLLGRGDRRVGFGAKALLGGGRATVTTSFDDFLRDDRFDGFHDNIVVPLPPVPVPVTVRVRERFFIAEPEANLLIGVSKHVQITAGVGYRLIAADRGSYRDVRGVTGTVGVQIGGGL